MKKAIALHLTDTHANNNNLDLQESIWLQATRVCKELKIKHICHGGDWVTSRKAQSLAVLEHMVWIKDLLKKNNIDLIGITGNHDKTNQESVFAYPNLLDEECFSIIEESYCMNISAKVDIYFISYFPELGSFKERFENIRIMDPKKKSILVCHQGINGGLSHKNATINKELPTGMFDAFDTVLVGHYHNRNLVEHDGDNDIWYTGSTYAANYGEDNDKGFTIIYDDGSIEFHQTDFPRYETISVDVTEIDGKWLSTTKKHIASTGTNVRVIVTGDESELKKVKKQKFSDIGVKKLQLNIDSVGLIDPRGSATYVSLDKETVRREYSKFCVSQEIDSYFGISYLK